MHGESDDSRSHDGAVSDPPIKLDADLPDDVAADLPEELADVLEDPHGRSALVYLSRREGHVDLEELSRGVAGLVTGESPDVVSDTSARQVRTWLHHGHLPVLDDHGVVDYDPGAGRVVLLDRPVPFENPDPPPGGLREE